MMNILTITDKTIAGKNLNALDIEIENDKISVEDIIRQRVTKEVHLFNNKAKKLNSLVTPSTFELALNKPRKKPKEIDVEEQIYIALDGFLTNQFFILINNQQVEQLNTTFLIKDIEEVAFIKLTQLVGG